MIPPVERVNWKEDQADKLLRAMHTRLVQTGAESFLVPMDVMHWRLMGVINRRFVKANSRLVIRYRTLPRINKMRWWLGIV